MSDPLAHLAGPDTPVNPRPEFAAQLKRQILDLETQTGTANQRPQGVPMTEVFIPYLSVTDSRAAMEFYTAVFGAVQSAEPIMMDDGRVGHAEMTIGGQRIYMADEFPEMNLLAPTTRGGSGMALVINVADADVTYQAALDAGATGERPPSNAHGQRNGWFADPWGHRWSPTSAEKA